MAEIVLDGVSLARGERTLMSGVSGTVSAGEILAVVGPSGIGKSTLIEALLGDLEPSAGSVRVLDQAPSLPRRQRSQLGIIPQEARQSADPRLTLAETVAAPLSFAHGRLRPKARDLTERALVLWDRVRLERELLECRPHEVSDGQLQRALVVRALTRPVRVLLADEPTSALDSRTARHVWRLIGDAVEEDRTAAVVVSHDTPALTEMAASTIRLGAVQR